MNDFFTSDLNLFQQKGIEVATINQQIAAFKKGFPAINLVSPATIGHGMMKYSEQEVDNLIAYFDDNKDNFELLKFVPASGAASRMFKHLFEFVQSFQGTADEIEALETDTDTNSVGYLLQNIQKLALFNDLKAAAFKQSLDVNQLLNKKQYKTIIQHILDD